LSGRDLIALADDAGHLRTHLFDRDVERLEDTGGKALFLAEQAEQNVFRADVVVLESPGFVLREDDYLASPFSEAFEQIPRPPFLKTYRNAIGVIAHRSKVIQS
jgi:hypothetical protein